MTLAATAIFHDHLRQPYLEFGGHHSTARREFHVLSFYIHVNLAGMKLRLDENALIHPFWQPSGCPTRFVRFSSHSIVKCM